MTIDVPILGFGRAGGYRVISRLASEWIRMGHEVRIFSNRASIDPYFPTDAEIVWLDEFGRKVSSNAPDLLQFQSGAAHVAKNLFSLFLGLCRYSRASDVILANHSLTAWPVFLSVSRARKFYYVQAYEAEFYAEAVTGRKRLLQLQAWLSYHLPLYRIVNAPVYLNYRNLHADTWVPPGVDFSLFKPSSSECHFKRDILTLACIGRREPDKGTRYVTDAFAILKSSYKTARLLVAYGNLPAEAESMEDVHVIVPANDSELADFYRRADVFIAPALGQHGAPHYPVMEAMACGIPLVTTGYLPANEENCWLVPERDPHAIAEAVREILNNAEDRRQRVRNALDCIEPYKWQAVAKRMVDNFCWQRGPQI